MVTKEEQLSLWSKAMNNLKGDRSFFDQDEKIRIIVFIRDDVDANLDVKRQILSDSALYKKWDAIAMWVGVDGLIEYEPKLVLDIIEMFKLKLD